MAGPLPQKLVHHIRSGQFVEMRDLLADNMLLLDRLEATPSFTLLPATGFTSRPRLREVLSPISWAVCFLSYVSILTSDPQTRSQLTYARLILSEAQSHNSTGWLDYDRAFRQLQATSLSAAWDELNPGLYTRLILSRRTGPPPTFCTLCHASDHLASQCALAFTLPPTTPRRPSSSPRPHRSYICQSWNRGLCIFPGRCSYRHVCANCQQSHMAKDCPSPPTSSS
jgi:hypothetical protein